MKKVNAKLAALMALTRLSQATQNASKRSEFLGTPPKIYGEWLQRTGRQKWCK